jgi:uncharacterized protein
MVRSEHPTTIEITTEEHLTAKGDCIVGVGASKGCSQLEEGVKNGLRTEGAKVLLRIVVGPHSFEVKARGDPRLELTHPCDIVIRRSTFISDRTVAVEADRAARDIPRPMVQLLRAPTTLGSLELEVL